MAFNKVHVEPMVVSDVEDSGNGVDTIKDYADEKRAGGDGADLEGQTKPGASSDTHDHHEYNRLERDVSKPGMSFFSIMIGLQVAFIIAFGFFVRYGNSAGGQQPDDVHDKIAYSYAHFQDVHVMIFIGFGMLMMCLRKYSYSAVAVNMLLAVIVIQWHILIGYGFFHQLFLNDFHPIRLSLDTFLYADFAAAVVLITFGVLLGKAQPTTLIIIAILETIFFSLNEEIAKEMKISDVGGSVVVHTFGAYFGLAASFALGPFRANADKKKSVAHLSDHNDAKSSYQSDMFAMIGAIFLWMYWPSFNSGPASDYDKERVIINTLLALCGSTMASFTTSFALRGGKFDMVDIQNASLAGGVAVGTSSNFMINPVGGLVIGTIAGFVSVFGYVHITPFLARKFNLHDTCGVHNLHGMPGIIAAVAGAIFAGAATIEAYGTADNLYAVFPYRAAPHDRTASKQAAYQFLFLLITLGIAIVGGYVTGFIAKLLTEEREGDDSDEVLYNDEVLFEVPTEEIPYYFDQRVPTAVVKRTRAKHVKSGDSAHEVAEILGQKIERLVSVVSSKR